LNTSILSQRNVRMFSSQHVVVVGGGMAGLNSCYYMADQSDTKITLIERHSNVGQEASR